MLPSQVWGNVVRDWLEELLPENAHEICRGRVYISVVRLPFRREYISTYTSKQDLIATCLASAHIPLLMDGRSVSFSSYHKKAFLLVPNSFSSQLTCQDN